MLPMVDSNKIAFIGSYPPGVCPIAEFTQHVVENMLPASYGAFEPVMIAVESDVTRDYPDDVNFVIRKNFPSDYIEAGDFINAGHGDVVLVQHHFDLFGPEGAGCVSGLLKNLAVPVITTLHDVTNNLPECYFDSLRGVCEASEKLLVKDKKEFELLSGIYGVPQSKIELVIPDRSDNPFDREEHWFYVGRQYWQIVREHIIHQAGDLPSVRAERELSVLYGQ